MVTPFPDIDPYKVLGVAADAAPADIKKAYRKKCLIYHPDKLFSKPEREKKEAKIEFEKIAFAFAVLGDVKRRKRYDDTGSLDQHALDPDDEGFDWKDYFDTLKEQPVTEELIEQDRKAYQGSTEEHDDIVDAFQYYEGDFLKLFESIPHLEFSMAEESRVFDLVKEQVAKKSLKDYRKWQLYVKNRDKKSKAYLKKMAKEAKEAEELKSQLKLPKQLPDTGGEDGLKALIQKKNSNKFDDMISHLENKYGAGKVTKKKKKTAVKNSKKSTYDELDGLDDESFRKTQEKLLRK